MLKKYALVLALLLFALQASVCPVFAQHGAPRAAKVVVAKVKLENIRSTVDVVGTALPELESSISSEIAGLVAKLSVNQGDKVKKGQLICKLRDVELKFIYAESQATLEGLQQQLNELEAGTRKEDIDRLKAMVNELKSVREKWDREKKRVDKLYREKAASIKEYRDTISDCQVSHQRLFQAEAELAKAIAGPRKQAIARARAEVAAQRARVNQIKDKLNKTSIKAPFTGYVTSKDTEVGQWINIGGSVVNLIAIDVILARVDVPGRAIGFVRKGDPAEVWVDALGRQFEGKVVHIIPSGDVSARTFPVEIRIDNPKGLIKAGMFVRGKLPAGPKMRAVVVSKDALVRRGPMRMVYAVRHNIAMPVVVRTGLENRANIAIFGKIKPGELVVIRGNERLMPGQPVEIIKTEKAAGSGR